MSKNWDNTARTRVTGIDLLATKEIIFTFDDEPENRRALPGYSMRSKLRVFARPFSLLDTGQSYLPILAKRVEAEGHTIGTHTHIHRWLQSMSSFDDQVDEIERGIQTVTAALGGNQRPFFRFPYLGGTPQIERHLQQRRIVVWDIDAEVRDAEGMSVQDVVDRAMSELRNRGKGVLLLHDVQHGDRASSSTAVAGIGSWRIQGRAHTRLLASMICPEMSEPLLLRRTGS